MRFRPLLTAALLPMALAACTAGVRPEAAQDKEAPLHTEVFGKVADPAWVRTLIIVIHDDGDPGARSDEAVFAQAAVNALPEALAVTILRPGHRNPNGGASSGSRGAGKGDDFTLDRLTRLGRQIEQLKSRYPRANIVLVGDGGGAALVADIAGLNPDTATGILLVGCPCALPEWRTHMAAKTADPAWRAAVDSLDPLKFAGGVSVSLRVAVLVGADDAITPVSLSRAYVEALTLRGIATDYRIVPGKGHALLNDPETLSALTRLVASLPEKS